MAVAAVWGTAFAVAEAVVPPGFEGEHLGRSLAASMVLAAAACLVTGALLARGLRLRHPWPFAASGLVLTVIVALCGYAIAREARGGVGILFFVACLAVIYAVLAACVGRTTYPD
ncbi:hypothetical protein [Actinoplanes sp. NPDC049316]|uniref:hypothetical protein n=1 Tax=Actinoplanes sp. NPDC049316 TaxID=3154727 RepID=UPI0034337610